MARGNPVMKAKRVTGPTPNTVLLTACKTAKCSACGETGNVVRTIPTAGAVVRTCNKCLVAKRGIKQSAITHRGWRPTL